MPFIETNGIQTHYEREGDGEPLVLVHGATSDHQLWGHQVAALSDGYEVITYDMRGPVKLVAQTCRGTRSTCTLTTFVHSSMRLSWSRRACAGSRWAG